MRLDGFLMVGAPAGQVGRPDAIASALEARRAEIVAQAKAGLSVGKIGVLLERKGVIVPYRTLHRFCVERCGFGKTAATLRVADGGLGAECQLDFGCLGLLADPVTGRQRKGHALIFTVYYSRHIFVWLSLTQTLAAVVAGCGATWVFFGGVLKVLVPDEAAAIVADADVVTVASDTSDCMNIRACVVPAMARSWPR
jgi:hypothetical protein